VENNLIVPQKVKNRKEGVMKCRTQRIVRAEKIVCMTT
jgi:hypothetical protein